MGRLLALIFFRISGWKVDWNIPEGTGRCVMTAAPHTSNWDIIYTRAAFSILRIPVKFTIKKEWMRFPYAPIVRMMGGIGIDRSPKKPGDDRPSMTQAMAELFTARDRLAVLVTPEGTRKLRTEWKTGFYYIAKMADVPVTLGYLDYSTKTAGVGPAIYPSDNIDEDLQKIMAFYQTKHARYPEKFSVDIRYAPQSTVPT